ncbi:starvation-inducible DNA-binding protein [Paenibacillus shirakamiensis]|uniref:Starvation-inducible DNA-binding protein n=1 Tax=Paenibacillus shirakamiensis TaxID=1265935 RepID=A0ABS4JG68_9BACL|nr:Dps family protein [Paenibacillus shirakamiensis]MBP2000709.1 starvation-inducible DNA-binding protein [Paenibacillus shirakamiensis]
MPTQIQSTQQATLEQHLNLQVANWTLLYTKLHHIHWYLSGPHFFTLHVKFEELFTEAGTYLDEIAERLLSIGGRPIATLKETLSTATIQEAKGTQEPNAWVAETIRDFAQLVTELKEARQVAEEAQDGVTEDLLLSIQSKLDKHIWMLQSYLGH